MMSAWGAANLTAMKVLSERSGKEYMVEINRISQALSTPGGLADEAGSNVAEYDLSPFHYVKQLSYLSASATAIEIDAFCSGSDMPTGMNYLVKPLLNDREIIGYVRYEYGTSSLAAYRYVFIIINSLFAVVLIGITLFLFYIRSKILLPFRDVQELPFELSKGRLKKGIKENKSRFFGRFVWGLDMLRESIATQKNKELALEKDKKTMILSISHGIKTPLSAIVLYSKALSDNLYEDEEKRRAAAVSIGENARQIESLVGEIVHSQTEDLIDIEVSDDEFYLMDLIDALKVAYLEKMILIHTEFVINHFSNILLQGDLQRLLDVFENLIENAIKYGDGKKITLNFQKEDNCLLVAVENTGIAISPNESTHIFESFWRGSNAHDKPGNGLGLYICKHIMKKMNGDIFIRNICGGMCFVVVIPIA
jgi:signal transduction histidine kinase